MKRYTDLNTYLQSIFGCRVHKIALDAGFGCPNRDGRTSTGGCIYCNANGSGTGALTRGLSITEQIEQSRGILARKFKARKFIAYFQSFTNTYAPIERLRTVYDEALSINDIVGLSIGTRPDCVSSPVLDLLESYATDHLVWIEYGLQSIHDRTLERINRGHDFNCFRRALEATRNRGIRICAHLILGLPGESAEDMRQTAETVARMGLDGVKLHLLYVVKGTPMENLYRSGQYRCLEQMEYTSLVCDFLERLPPGVVIQRLTGDPHPGEVVAPQWALEKQANLALIDRLLEERDTRQGQLFSGS